MTPPEGGREDGRPLDGEREDGWVTGREKKSCRWRMETKQNEVLLTLETGVSTDL